MNKEIPYYPELRELIPDLGFKTSTSLISYLRKSRAPYTIIDRVYTTEQRIDENVEMMKNSLEVNEESFIFVMSVPESDRIEIIHCFGLSKNEMMKYLQLKTFS